MPVLVYAAGATIDTIVARNFGRMVAAGTAAHTDHGMAMLDLFRGVIDGSVKDFEIKDTIKLREVAESLDIVTDGRSTKDIATDLYKELELTYTQVDGEIPLMKRVPPKTLESWHQEGIVPRGAMREIMEMMHRTAMGVDQDYENITKQISRTALADGWGGSMVSTEISDILFGTPTPVEVEVDIQCIKQDLNRVAECYDTVFITTNYRAKIEGALHIELDEHDPLQCTDEIIIRAISRFKNRKKPIQIPRQTTKGIHGFSHEYIKYMLGGSFRCGYEPLNDNIINGRLGVSPVWLVVPIHVQNRIFPMWNW